MISDQDIAIRLIIGALLGALVGFERERQGQPAGLRTHIILVIGATLTMTLSVNIAIQFRPFDISGDPARLAAQVISGIGFLGAGAILRYGATIKGLTTATSLWTMAVVGLTVGAGHFISAIAATVLIMITLIILNVFEKRFIHAYVTMLVQVIADNRLHLLDEVNETLSKLAKLPGSPSVEKSNKSKKMRIQYTVRLSSRVSVEQVIDTVAAIDGVRSVKIY
jgi:putative Mg2+ transporter-C (MgtC) family protein